MAPIIADYWERAEFPHELVPKLAKLGLSGATLKGNGCPGQSILAAVSAPPLSRPCPALPPPEPHGPTGGISVSILPHQQCRFEP